MIGQVARGWGETLEEDVEYIPVHTSHLCHGKKIDCCLLLSPFNTWETEAQRSEVAQRHKGG